MGGVSQVGSGRARTYGSRLALGLIVWAATALSARASGFLDQAYVPTDFTTSTAFRIDQQAPVGQSFMSEIGTMTGVAFYIQAPTGPGVFGVRIRLGDINGPALGTVTQPVPQGFDGFVHLDVDSLSVSPGQEYTLELLSSNENLFARAVNVQAHPPGYAGGYAYQQGSANINQDLLFRTFVPTSPVIRFAPPVVSQPEENQQNVIPFSVTLPAAYGVPISVDYATRDAGTTAGDDYEPISGTLSFDPGERSKSLLLTIYGDTNFEGEEVLFIDLSNPVNATLNTPSVRITLLNDDSPRFSIDDVSLNEGSIGNPDATFTISLNGTNPGPGPMNVQYETVDGTALAGQDYVARAGSVQILPGASSATVDVSVNGDALFEPDETFTVRLTQPQGQFADPDGVGTILNDDPVPIRVTPFVTKQEGDVGPLAYVFTVLLNGQEDVPVSVDYVTRDGSATAGEDYEQTSGTLTFAPGQTGQSIQVLVFGDTSFEGQEDFFVDLSNPVNGAIATGQGSGRGEIRNDDQAFFSIDDVAVEEGNSGTTLATFTVSINGVAGPGVGQPSAQYETVDGTAISGDDYSPRTGTVTIPSGASSASVEIPILGDTDLEPDETFTVRLSGALFTDPLGQATIRNDDAPDLQITSNVSHPEGDAGSTTAYDFLVNLSGQTSQTVTVDFATRGATAQAGSDFTHETGQLTFLPGVTEQTITVSVNGDGLFENVEFFFVDLLNPVNATATLPVGRGDLLNDDDVTVSIEQTVQVVEGDAGFTTGEVMVSLSTASGGPPISVGIVLVPQTAQIPTDFVPVSGLTFNAGETEKALSLSIVGDTIPEPIEQFLVRINPSSVYEIDGLGQSIVRIVDNDGIPSVSVDDISRFEGNSGTKVYAFTVSLSNAHTTAITVDAATADDTAIAGDDYVAASETLTFDPGVTSRTFNVTVNGDANFEGAESFNVNLANASVPVADPQGIGTIRNDDPPLIRFTQTVVSVPEGTGPNVPPVGLVVTLQGPVEVPVRVDFATRDEDAVAGEDYVSTSGTLVFAPGDVVEQISVPRVGDSTYEGNEAFSVDLSNPTNGTLLQSQSSARVTLTNDDIGQLSVSDVTIDEGNSGTTPATFTISLVGVAGASGLSVSLQTEDGSATEGEDYVGRTSVVTIPPGESSVVFAVPVTGDTDFEPDETFRLRLIGGPSQIQLIDPIGEATITNDDPVGIRVSTLIQRNEGHTGQAPLTFSLLLTGSEDVPVSVDFATRDQTATAGEDYLAASGTVTFAPGETSRNIPIQVLGDTDYEGDELFLVDLTNPVNGTILVPLGRGEILNDDLATYSISDVTVDESDNGTSAQFTVSIDGIRPLGASLPGVTFQTIPVTAQPDEDYLHRAGSIGIPFGGSSATISVPIIGDTVYEPDETFRVQIAGVGVLFADQIGEGTIRNDDPPVVSIQPVLTQAEGSGGGTATFSFSVTMSGPVSETVSVNYHTFAGSATSGNDFATNNGTLTFLPDQTEKAIPILVLQDGLYEDDETFQIRLDSPVNATLGNAVGNGTISNDDIPFVSIDPPSVQVVEGNTGLTQVDFTVSLSLPSGGPDIPVVVGYEGISATLFEDFRTGPNPVFGPGETVKTLSVQIVGDTVSETNEAFTIRLLSGPAQVAPPGLANVTILDDEPPIVSIAAPPSMNEGNPPGPTPFNFLVRLNRPTTEDVSVTVQQTPGTAIPPDDYVSEDLSLVIPAGQSAATGDVDVIADFVDEPDETFDLFISNAVNAEIDVTPTSLTIVNDDAFIAQPDLNVFGRFVYADGPGNIFIADGDGGNEVQLTSGTSDRSPVLSPDGSRIVFSSERDGNFEIYVMDADGSNQTRLTNAVDADDQPTWTPDGSRIVFRSNQNGGDSEIFSMRASDGGDVVNLTNTPGFDAYPDVSPDGTLITFSSLRDGNFEIHVMGIDGSNPVNVTNDPAEDMRSRWSPDSDRLAFQSKRDDSAGDVYVANPDGSGVQRLTFFPGSDVEASWSADGTEVAFRSHRTGSFELWRVRASGGVPIQLTSGLTGANPSWEGVRRVGDAVVGESVVRSVEIRNDGEVPLNVSDIVSDAPEFAVSPTSFAVPVGGVQSVDVTFTAPGEGVTYGRITVSSDDPDNPIDFTVNGTGVGGPEPDLNVVGRLVYAEGGNIFVADQDGINAVQLTTSSSTDHYPVLSPDGTQIVFSSDRDGNPEIYVMDADGSNVRRLTNAVDADDYPTWTPDGSRIVFRSNQNGGDSEIFSMRASDGGDVVNLTNTPGFDAYPDVSPDGTRITFSSLRDGNFDVFVMGIDGSNPVNVTNDAAEDLRSVWSPDGSGIAFQSQRDDPSGDVYVMDADGSNVQRLTSFPGSDIEPSWLGDGTKVGFRSNRSGTQDLWVASASGGAPELLLSSFGGFQPRWEKVQRVGDAQVGNPVVRSIEIRNDGEVPLNVSDIVSDVPEFSVSPSSFSVPVGGVQSVDVTFTASGEGVTYGRITVSSDDRDDPIDFIVNGTGVSGPEPDLNVVSRLVYAESGNIFVADQDGSNAVQLTTSSSTDHYPVLSPDGTQIVFSSDRDGNPEIYVMDADGSNVRRLTNAVDADDYPTWTPDGSRIVFRSNQNGGDSEIFSMRASDGGDVVNLTNTPGFDAYPDVSPDGTRITFSSLRDGNFDVFVMGIDGSNPVNVTNDAAEDLRSVWSPDGSRIAFQSQRDDPSGDVYVIDADGSNVQRLTSFPGSDVEPSWLGDGTKVGFRSNRSGTQDLWVASASGGAPELLLSSFGGFQPRWEKVQRVGDAQVGNPVVRSIEIRNDGEVPLNVSDIVSDAPEFAVSPTSFAVPVGGVQSVDVTFTASGEGVTYGRITVSSDDRDDPIDFIVNGTGVSGPEPDLEIVGPIVFSRVMDLNDTDLYRSDSDGSNLTAILDDAHVNSWPAWSPDGSQVAFAAFQSGAENLYVIDADGANLTQLTENTDGFVGNTNPTWSPDGSRIAFASNRNDNTVHIYVMNADGSDETQITTGSTQHRFPDWSPDGSLIAVEVGLFGGIWTMEPDGSSLTQLTNGQDIQPAWSPDGARIAFARNQDIYLVDADGSGIEQVTNDVSQDQQVKWSPDGQRLVYGARRDGEWGVYTVDLDGSDEVQVSDPIDEARMPSWRPFRRVGATEIGTPVQATLTVENRGSADLNVTGIQLSDGQFTAMPDNFSLLPNAVQAVTVTFDPTAADLSFSLLTIQSDDPDGDATLLINGFGQTDPGPQPPPLVDFLPPQAGAQVCLPPYMIRDTDEIHTWWAYSSGGDLEIDVIAVTESAGEAGAVLIRAFDFADVQVASTGADFTGIPGQDASETMVIPGTLAGARYRVEVRVFAAPPPPSPFGGPGGGDSFPPPPGGDPGRHYRLSLRNAFALGADSQTPSQAESAAARWNVNSMTNETVDLIVQPGVEDGATTATINVYEPFGTLAASSSLGLPITIPPASGGVWTVEITGTDGHYTIEKTSGFDRGVYAMWPTYGTGTVAGSITRSGQPNTTPVTVRVTDDLTGTLLSEVAGATDSYAMSGLPVGNLTVTVVEPSNPLPGQGQLTCDANLTIDFDLPSGNVPPVADAGPDQDLVCPGDAMYVPLDGSSSSDSDGTLVRFTWSEGGQVLVTGDEETAGEPTVLLSVGVHAIDLEVEDDGGLTATDQVVITVSKDDAAPIITIAGPDDGSYVRGSGVVVTGAITEQVGLQSFTLNGREKTVIGEAPDFTFSAGVGRLVEGPNTITAEATDISGNVATPAVITVHRDRTKPVVVIQTPQEGQVFTDSPAIVSVSGTASDPSPDGVNPGSGVATVMIGNTEAAYDPQTEAFTADTEVRGEGNRRIRVRATDRVGNRVDAFVSVLIDSRAPSLRITSPTNNATVTGTELTVIGTAHDAGSGIATLTVNGQPASLDERDYTATLTIVEGPLTVDVVATDNTGKQTTKSVSVNVIGDPTTSNTIAMRLETSGGDPIAGRRVDLRKVVNGAERGTGLRQNTDVDGNVLFEVDPGLTYRLRVTHNGAATTTGDLTSGADITVATIPSSVTILGTATGEEGVRVDLLKPNGKGSGVRVNTDASGIAAFEVLPNTEHSFKVSFAGESLTTSEVIVAEGGSSSIEVQLALVTVTVSSFDGTETFPGVRTDLLKPDGKGTGVRRLTDDVGTAHFYALPGATHGARVSFRGGTYTTAIGTVPATGQTFDVRTAELRLSLSGDSGDIEGARADLLKALGKGTGTRAFTDPSGYAAFDVLTGPDAIHALRVRYLGGDYATTEVSIPEGAEFHLFDVSTVTSTVTLVDHAGSGIPDARVDLRSGDGKVHGLKTFTGPDGSVDFDILPGYDHTFKLYLSGGTWTSGTLSDDEDLTVQAQLTQLCLTDAAGDPIAGARVDLLRADASKTGVRMFTDPLGKAGFDALPDYHVRFKITYNGDSYTTELVPCGELLTLGLDIQVSVVSLVLTDSAGDGIDGVRVDLLKSDGRGTGVRANTDANGFVSFDVVPEAQHRMKIRYHGGQYETAPVAAGDQAAVRTVASTVTFKDTIDVPLDSVRVDLLKENGSGAGVWTRTGRTGTSGVAHFEVLPDQFAHLFKVRFSGGTLVVPGESPVTVAEGASNDVPVQTIRSMLTVRDIGVPVEGARVDLRRYNGDGSDSGTSVRRFTIVDGTACFEVLPGFAHLMRVRVDGVDHDTPPLQDVADLFTTLNIGGPLPPPPLMKRALGFEPIVFGMEQNHPNPFNPSTVIRYAIAEHSRVRLVVYNALGQVIRVLVDEDQRAGRYTVSWDGQDSAGRHVASGLYLYQLTSGEDKMLRRMLLTK